MAKRTRTRRQSILISWCSICSDHDAACLTSSVSLLLKWGIHLQESQAAQIIRKQLWSFCFSADGMLWKLKSKPPCEENRNATGTLATCTRKGIIKGNGKAGLSAWNGWDCRKSNEYNKNMSWRKIIRKNAEIAGKSIFRASKRYVMWEVECSVHWITTQDTMSRI